MQPVKEAESDKMGAGEHAPPEEIATQTSQHVGALSELIACPGCDPFRRTYLRARAARS